MGHKEANSSQRLNCTSAPPHKTLLIPTPWLSWSPGSCSLALQGRSRTRAPATLLFLPGPIWPAGYLVTSSPPNRGGPSCYWHNSTVRTLPHPPSATIPKVSSGKFPTPVPYTGYHLRVRQCKGEMRTPEQVSASELSSGPARLSQAPHFLQVQVKNKHGRHFPCRPQRSANIAESSLRAPVTTSRETPLPLTVDSKNPQALKPHNTFPAKKVAISSGLKLDGGGRTGPLKKVLWQSLSQNP